MRRRFTLARRGLARLRSRRVARNTTIALIEKLKAISFRIEGVTLAPWLRWSREEETFRKLLSVCVF